MVEIRIYGPLGPGQNLAPRLDLEIEEGRVSVADLLARLGLDTAEVGIVTVDGRQSGADALLPAGCRVCIFPPMFGG